MELTSILVAIVTGSITLIGVIINAKVQYRNSDTRREVQNQKVNDRLEIIEKKLDIHNGYAERFGEIEKSITSIQKDIEYIKKN